MATTLLSEVGRGAVGHEDTMAFVPLTPEDVGSRIVAAREAMKPKPWSQFDLALALGVSPSTVYRWEKGRLPSMNELLRLAEVLEIPSDYLTEPPERQLGLRDLHALLEGAREEAETGRGALIATLTSLDFRLSRIENALGIPADRDSETHSS